MIDNLLQFKTFLLKELGSKILYQDLKINFDINLLAQYLKQNLLINFKIEDFNKSILSQTEIALTLLAINKLDILDEKQLKIAKKLIISNLDFDKITNSNLKIVYDCLNIYFDNEEKVKSYKLSIEKKLLKYNLSINNYQAIKQINYQENLFNQLKNVDFKDKNEIEHFNLILNDEIDYEIMKNYINKNIKNNQIFDYLKNLNLYLQENEKFYDNKKNFYKLLNIYNLEIKYIDWLLANPNQYINLTASIINNNIKKINNYFLNQNMDINDFLKVLSIDKVKTKNSIYLLQNYILKYKNNKTKLNDLFENIITMENYDDKTFYKDYLDKVNNEDIIKINILDLETFDINNFNKDLLVKIFTINNYHNNDKLIELIKNSSKNYLLLIKNKKNDLDNKIKLFHKLDNKYKFEIFNFDDLFKLEPYFLKKFFLDFKSKDIFKDDFIIDIKNNFNLFLNNIKDIDIEVFKNNENNTIKLLSQFYKEDFDNNLLFNKFNDLMLMVLLRQEDYIYKLKNYNDETKFTKINLSLLELLELNDKRKFPYTNQKINSLFKTVNSDLFNLNENEKNIVNKSLIKYIKKLIKNKSTYLLSNLFIYIKIGTNQKIFDKLNKNELLYLFEEIIIPYNNMYLLQTIIQSENIPTTTKSNLIIKSNIDNLKDRNSYLEFVDTFFYTETLTDIEKTKIKDKIFNSFFINDNIIKNKFSFNMRSSLFLINCFDFNKNINSNVNIKSIYNIFQYDNDNKIILNNYNKQLLKKLYLQEIIKNPIDSDNINNFYLAKKLGIITLNDLLNINYFNNDNNFKSVNKFLLLKELVNTKEDYLKVINIINENKILLFTDNNKVKEDLYNLEDFTIKERKDYLFLKILKSNEIIYNQEENLSCSKIIDNKYIDNLNQILNNFNIQTDNINILTNFIIIPDYNEERQLFDKINFLKSYILLSNKEKTLFINKNEFFNDNEKNYLINNGFQLLIDIFDKNKTILSATTKKQEKGLTKLINNELYIIDNNKLLNILDKVLNTKKENILYKNIFNSYLTFNQLKESSFYSFMSITEKKELKEYFQLHLYKNISELYLNSNININFLTVDYDITKIIMNFNLLDIKTKYKFLKKFNRAKYLDIVNNKKEIVDYYIENYIDELLVNIKNNINNIDDLNEFINIQKFFTTNTLVNLPFFENEDYKFIKRFAFNLIASDNTDLLFPLIKQIKKTYIENYKIKPINIDIEKIVFLFPFENQKIKNTFISLINDYIIKYNNKDSDKIINYIMKNSNCNNRLFIESYYNLISIGDNEEKLKELLKKAYKTNNKNSYELLFKYFHDNFNNIDTLPLKIKDKIDFYTTYIENNDRTQLLEKPTLLTEKFSYIYHIDYNNLNNEKVFELLTQDKSKQFSDFINNYLFPDLNKIKYETKLTNYYNKYFELELQLSQLKQNNENKNIIIELTNNLKQMKSFIRNYENKYTKNINLKLMIFSICLLSAKNANNIGEINNNKLLFKNFDFKLFDKLNNILNKKDITKNDYQFLEDIFNNRYYIINFFLKNDKLSKNKTLLEYLNTYDKLKNFNLSKFFQLKQFTTKLFNKFDLTIEENKTSIDILSLLANNKNDINDFYNRLDKNFDFNSLHYIYGGLEKLLEKKQGKIFFDTFYKLYNYFHPNDQLISAFYSSIDELTTKFNVKDWSKINNFNIMIDYIIYINSDFKDIEMYDDVGVYANVSKEVENKKAIKIVFSEKSKNNLTTISENLKENKEINHKLPLYKKLVKDNNNNYYMCEIIPVHDKRTYGQGIAMESCLTADGYAKSILIDMSEQPEKWCTVMISKVFYDNKEKLTKKVIENLEEKIKLHNKYILENNYIENTEYKKIYKELKEFTKDNFYMIGAGATFLSNNQCIIDNMETHRKDFIRKDGKKIRINKTDNIIKDFIKDFALITPLYALKQLLKEKLDTLAIKEDYPLYMTIGTGWSDIDTKNISITKQKCDKRYFNKQEKDIYTDATKKQQVLINVLKEYDISSPIEFYDYINNLTKKNLENLLKSTENKLSNLLIDNNLNNNINMNTITIN